MTLLEESKRDARRKTKAREMRAAGAKLREIGEALGVDNSTVWKWLNPERTRELNEADRERRREQRRATDRLRNRAHRAVCVDCGELAGIGTGRRSGDHRCKACCQKHTEARHALIKSMWADGRSLREIAEALGTTKESLGVTFVRIRRTEGAAALPYRYRRHAKEASPLA